MAQRHSLFLMALCASLLAGCDMATNMTESLAHAGPIEAEIQKATGVKPSVFSASYGSGPRSERAAFSEVPAQSVQSLEAICRAAVVHEFKKPPTSLTLSFVFKARRSSNGWPFARLRRCPSGLRSPVP